MECDSKDILEIDSVQLSYGENEVLRGLYLKIECGVVTTILGRNGCGKSSLMRLLSGEIQRGCKSIRINSVWQKKLNNRQLLYLPQQTTLPSGLYITTLFKDFKVDIYEFMSAFPDIIFDEYTKVKHLSGGAKRIIEIYLIIKAKSQFALLDEPFSQVMPIHIDTIKRLIVEAKEFKGILLTDHLYKQALDITDVLYCMRDKTVYRLKNFSELAEYGYIT